MPRLPPTSGSAGLPFFGPLDRPEWQRNSGGGRTATLPQGEAAFSTFRGLRSRKRAPSGLRMDLAGLFVGVA